MKTPSSVTEYIVWLIKQYQEIKNTYAANAYRIVSSETTPQGKTLLTIQVCGKSTLFKLTPIEILRDDQILEGFSKSDIRMITYLACNEQQPKSRIVLQEFCEKINKIVFGIKRPGKKEILKKTAAEISLDKDLLKDLTPEESHIIGFTTASDSFIPEKEAINKIRSKDKK